MRVFQAEHSWSDEQTWCPICGGLMRVKWQTHIQVLYKCTDCDRESLHGQLTDANGQAIDSFGDLVREYGVNPPPDTTENVLPFMEVDDE